MFSNHSNPRFIRDLNTLTNITESVLQMVKVVDCFENAMKIQRRWWVHPINQNRANQGDFENLLTEITQNDDEKFFQYTRMEIPQFKYLLSLVKPFLTKHSNRKGLPEALRLLITLRYLATGDSYASLAFAYRIGQSTVQTIIPEVCNVIWSVLQPKYLSSKTTDDWLQDAEDFSNIWNFPHCLGGIDGKHIAIQAPRKTGTLYFNYKKYYSIVLLGVADANYKFSYVDIGAYGSQSDGGILTNSTLGMLLESGKMNYPQPAPLLGEYSNVPYFMVGDEAFPLKTFLIIPFSGQHLGNSKECFNKRLSRARRVVENAFGILAARWRIYHRSIIGEPNTVDSIVKATVVLHNMLCESCRHRYAPATFVDRHNNNGVWTNGSWRAEVASSQLNPIPSNLRLESRNPIPVAIQTRNYLMEWISKNNNL